MSRTEAKSGKMDQRRHKTYREVFKHKTMKDVKNNQSETEYLSKRTKTSTQE